MCLARCPSRSLLMLALMMMLMMMLVMMMLMMAMVAHGPQHCFHIRGQLLERWLRG